MCEFSFGYNSPRYWTPLYALTHWILFFTLFVWIVFLSLTFGIHFDKTHSHGSVHHRGLFSTEVCSMHRRMYLYPKLKQNEWKKRRKKMMKNWDVTHTSEWMNLHGIILTVFHTHTITAYTINTLEMNKKNNQNDENETYSTKQLFTHKFMACCILLTNTCVHA